MASAAPLRIWRPFKLTPLMRVCAVKGDEGRVQRMHVALAQIDIALSPARQCCGLPAFRRPAKKAARHRPAAPGVTPCAGMKVGRLAVAERDRAGLVEQQHIHVARRFDRAPGHGDHIGLDHAIHARDADGGEQPADGRRDQADQQRDQHRDRDRLALTGCR